MVRQPRVVIIGADLVGCALADELASRGWTDVTVLAQGPLFATGGSDPHAPGPVFQTVASRTLTRFAAYTADKYASLTLDGQRCFRALGGLEVATTPQRWADLKRRHGWATSWGIDSSLATPDECAALHPLVDPGAVLGGFHVPGDGLAVPVRATEAQARRAMGRGARFLAHHRVTGIERWAGRVRAVTTEHGSFRADVVVSCAGLGGAPPGAMVDLDIPLVPTVHQYVWTTPLDALRGADGAGAGLPLLRDPEAGFCVQGHADRLGIDGYRHRCAPGRADEIGGPAEPAFTPEDFAPTWAAASALLPCLSGAGADRGVNGLIPFTPDGNPLLGEHPDLGGFWVAEAVGTPQSAGAARAVAEWLVDGRPSLDLRECEITRFDRLQRSPDYVRRRGTAVFSAVCDIAHPLEPSGPPRPLRCGPVHERQAELGAHFSEEGGWEVPRWYGSNADLPQVARIPGRNAWAARHWSPIVGAEALATREGVGLFDLSGRTRAEVTGPDALDFLQTMTTNRLDVATGTVVRTLMLDEDGGMRGDLTVARLGEERFHVGVSGRGGLMWLRGHLSRAETVQLRETTPGSCCLGLWGPRAPALLRSLTGSDGRGPGRSEVSAADLYVGGVPVTALRRSPVGEPGWELHTSADLGRLLWDTLVEAGAGHGLVAAGHGALDSLRLEHGHRVWGVDMTSEHDPYEAGLGAAVRVDKGYFHGREALRGRSHDTVDRRLARLLSDDTEQVVMGAEPVRADGRAVGYVTSAGRGHSVGRNIAYAWLPAAVAVPGTAVEIEYFGERVAATVAAEPLRAAVGRRARQELGETV
ncbi:FAD-dependent oxidoreductase [Nocardiopsis sp. YSL2]|uniref:GcvT family protein n=1 Tax=Nocardiopsis sp. YSL2 TaxID=2939492 RepID=UPI0026F438A8|nr:FAD-dependent oxidoreductase [Nocardiopsis sp. YSL2]